MQTNPKDRQRVVIDVKKSVLKNFNAVYYVIDRSVSNVDSSIEIHFMGYVIMISTICLNKKNLIVSVDVHLTLSNY